MRHNVFVLHLLNVEGFDWNFAHHVVKGGRKQHSLVGKFLALHICDDYLFEGGWFERNFCLLLPRLFDFLWRHLKFGSYGEAHVPDRLKIVFFRRITSHKKHACEVSRVLYCPVFLKYYSRCCSIWHDLIDRFLGGRKENFDFGVLSVLLNKLWECF